MHPRSSFKKLACLSLLLSLGLSPWLKTLAEPEVATPYTAGAKPLELETTQQTLNITNDIPLAEEQAREYPDDPEAQFLLAIAYSRSPYLEKAVKALQRTKRLIKKSPEGYATLDKLLTAYEETLQYRPNDPLILYRLAFGYYLKGYAIQRGYIKNCTVPAATYQEKAEATMRQSVAADPTDIWARNYLGYLLAEHNNTGSLDQAVRIWEDSLSLNTENPGAYLLLGEAYLKKGDMRKAMEYAAKGFQSRAAMGF